MFSSARNYKRGFSMATDGRSEMLRYRLRPLGDLVTVSGKVKQLYGVSCAHSEEFFERIQYLKAAALSSDNELSFDELMLSDALFAESADRCLKLNGLSRADVSLRQIQDLLLFELLPATKDEKPALAHGILVRINLPRTQSEVNTELEQSSSDTSFEAIVAALAKHNGSLSEAIELTTKLTSGELSAFMAASAKLQKEASESPVEPSGDLSAADIEDMNQKLDYVNSLS